MRKMAKPDPIPEWQRVAGFVPGSVPTPEERDEGLARLAQRIQDDLFAERRRQRASLAKSRRPVVENPFYDATCRVAANLGLPVSRLNAVCREALGFSARDFWDRIRAEEKEAPIAHRLRLEIEALLDGAPLDLGPRRLTVSELIPLLRRRRRLHGITPLGRAWRWGYAYPSRLERACFLATGLTLAELQVNLLLEVVRAWHYNRQRRQLYKHEHPAQPTTAAYLKGDGPPPASVPNHATTQEPAPPPASPV